MMQTLREPPKRNAPLMGTWQISALARPLCDRIASTFQSYCA
jgi:hypothetical protein